jgi:hypothetical protein
MNTRLRNAATAAIFWLAPALSSIVNDTCLFGQDQQKSAGLQLLEKTIQRTYSIHKTFRRVYTAGWEGANGAIGAAHLFAVTHDTTLLVAYSTGMNMLNMYNGTWVDDRAWICLAEMYWWHFTGRTVKGWVQDAKKRYQDAKAERRLSNHEGVWSWYNWPKTGRSMIRYLPTAT